MAGRLAAVRSGCAGFPVRQAGTAAKAVSGSQSPAASCLPSTDQRASAASRSQRSSVRIARTLRLIKTFCAVLPARVPVQFGIHGGDVEGAGQPVGPGRGRVAEEEEQPHSPAQTVGASPEPCHAVHEPRANLVAIARPKL
jgi:hypothetical protein